MPRRLLASKMTWHDRGAERVQGRPRNSGTCSTAQASLALDGK